MFLGRLAILVVLAPAMYVTLGQPFPVAAFVPADDGGDDILANSALVVSDFSLSFFEADGITPVNIAETPEPSGFGLFGLSSVAVYLSRFRQRLLRQRLQR